MLLRKRENVLAHIQADLKEDLHTAKEFVLLARNR